MKKGLRKTMGLLLSASLLAGCAGQKVVTVQPEDMGTERDPLIHNEEPITLTVFSQPANWSGRQIGWGATYLKDMFNIELNIIPDVSGAYETRMEKGDLGDIVVWGNPDKDYQEAVRQGKLFNLEEDDLLDIYGKDVQDQFAAAFEANKELNEDGEVHGIANNVASSNKDHDLFIYNWGIRWDLYEQLGKPEVKNLDDLAELLKQMKEIQPTGDDGKPTYAASLWPDWDGNLVMNVKGLAQAYYGYDELGIGLMDPETGKFYDALDPDGPYVEALRFYNKLYREGLMDPDSMTQTYDEMLAKVRNGNVLFSIQSFAGSDVYNTDDHLSENKLMAPLVPTQARTAVWALTPIGNERIWSIGANSLYPEKSMKFINWLYSPQGAMTIWYGIQGLMWDYDENGDLYLTELGQNCMNDSNYDLSGVEWTSPKTGKTYTLSGSFNDGMIQINNTSWAKGATNPESKDEEKYDYRTWISQAGDAKNEMQQDWRDTNGAVTEEEYLDSTDYLLIPAANYSEATRDPDLELKWQQVIKALKEGSWKMLYAKSEDEFNSLLEQTRKECDGYGYDLCVDWCVEESNKKFALMQENIEASSMGEADSESEASSQDSSSK